MNEDQLLKAATSAVYESISKSMSNDYNGPIKTAVNAVLDKHRSKIETIVEDAFLGLINTDGFRESVHSALQDKLARSLVAKLGGELESKVNDLKANPETRARITIAISECVKSIISVNNTCTVSRECLY